MLTLYADIMPTANAATVASAYIHVDPPQDPPLHFRVLIHYYTPFALVERRPNSAPHLVSLARDHESGNARADITFRYYPLEQKRASPSTPPPVLVADSHLPSIKISQVDEPRFSIGEENLKQWLYSVRIERTANNAPWHGLERIGFSLATQDNVQIHSFPVDVEWRDEPPVIATPSRITIGRFGPQQPPAHRIVILRSHDGQPLRALSAYSSEAALHAELLDSSDSELSDSVDSSDVSASSTRTTPDSVVGLKVTIQPGLITKPFFRGTLFVSFDHPIASSLSIPVSVVCPSCAQ